MFIFLGKAPDERPGEVLGIFLLPPTQSWGALLLWVLGEGVTSGVIDGLLCLVFPI